MSFREEVKKRIGEVLQRELTNIADETALRDLVMESFILIEMVIDIQETFSIRINQEDLAGVTQLGQLLNVIESRRANTTTT